MTLLDDGEALGQLVHEVVQEAEAICSFSFYHLALPQAYLEASLHHPLEMI